MPTIDLPTGSLRYRMAGPEDSTHPPVVFVHGFLVDSTLWTAVADRLAERGLRSYAPDWPLGSHRTPVPADADLSPPGVAAMVSGFLEALGLHDVTLVGNDTGGAICQMLIDADPSRIARLVLTNCDAFENFPPRFFLPIFKAAQVPSLLRVLMLPMRLRLVRHSPIGFGRLLRRPRDRALTRRWIEPALTDRRIRNDIARFARALDRTALVELAPRLATFPGEVRIVWGDRDRCFTMSSARRLEAAFTDATLVTVADASTFVPVDKPRAVADAITAMR